MSIGISTDGTKQKILENEPEKLNQAIKEKAKSLGISSIQSLKGKNQLEQLNDMEKYGALMSESIQEQKEIREHKTRERQRSWHTSSKIALRRFLESQEMKSKEEYDKRRIVFLDGGIKELESQLKMLPLRVLVKEIKDDKKQDELIAIPETHTEKHPRYSVVCVGEGVDEISIGDVVVAVAYAGVEIVSDGSVYRILNDCDILCKVEE